MKFKLTFVIKVYYKFKIMINAYNISSRILDTICIIENI